MKQALVTGGTRGIGAGVSRSLGEAGWSVIAASASQSELDAFVPQDGIKVQTLDVTDQVSVDTVFSDLTRLDALVNCAGILMREEEYNIDVFDALVFFVDPLSPMPHDVDVKALTRLATVYDLPMACSRSTADLIVNGLLDEDASTRA